MHAVWSILRHTFVVQLRCRRSRRRVHMCTATCQCDTCTCANTVCMAPSLETKTEIGYHAMLASQIFCIETNILRILASMQTKCVVDVCRSIRRSLRKQAASHRANSLAGIAIRCLVLPLDNLAKVESKALAVLPCKLAGSRSMPVQLSHRAPDHDQPPADSVFCGAPSPRVIGTSTPEDQGPVR